MNDSNISTLKGKYLTFKLADEFYGIHVSSILQIIAIPEVTIIQNTPDFVKGIINLRGRIIPLIDLRLKFGMEEKNYTERTSIVIIKFMLNDKMVFIGTIVDTVAEVIDIKDEQIEEKPEFGFSTNTQFILGIAKMTDRVITLLNIEDILTKDELNKLQPNQNKEKETENDD